ncbi:ATP-binding protein [Nocardioides sp. SYSU D00038]|uniref:sensor histidine kinase n=1 Tax=Nocardioides sp. SYSU D00038 TaxID=2812554 RepID=UPI001967C17B|nr:ATP-binding protein [Nocardioides sp. SYSU D00038]
MAGAGVVVGVRVVPGAPGIHRPVAIGLGGLICLLSLVSVVIAVANLGADSPDFAVHPEFFVTDVVLALLYGPFGALVMIRSGHVIGWALQLVALGFALTGFGIQYAVLGLDRDLPGYAAVVQVIVAGWVTGALVCLLVVPWLIGQRGPSGPRLVAAVVGLLVALSAGVVRYLSQIEGGPTNPVTGGGAVSDAAAAYDAAVIPVYFLLGLVGVAHLGWRARRAEPGERRSLLWVLVAVALTSFAYLVFEVGLSLGQPLLGLSAAGLFAAMVMLPAAIFVLVVRHDSWNLDLAVSRATVGALLTTAVLGAYVVLVWAGGRVLPVGRDSAGLLSVALLALVVMPVRTWLQRRVERLVFGSTTDAGELLDRLGTDMSTGSDDLTILEGLADGLRRSLRLDAVVVESRGPGLRVASGQPHDRMVSVPLHSRGREVGVLRLGAPSGERLDGRTVQLVWQIAGLVAVALDLALVNSELEGARTRLVDVRQEERRLLRRELHDGLGPSLAGISLALAAIDKTSTLEPDDAVLLGQLQEELSHRAEDVRQMARVLLPPALEHGRLGEALDALAQRFTQSRFAVTVSAERPDELDSRRQVALYHVAAEAVLNAYRHSGARHCSVVLDRLGGAVRLSVTDDGAGVPSGAVTGIGLASMRERAAELGGTFEMASAGSDGTGARVTVVLP